MPKVSQLLRGDRDRCLPDPRADGVLFSVSLPALAISETDKLGRPGSENDCLRIQGSGLRPKRLCYF